MKYIFNPTDCDFIYRTHVFKHGYSLVDDLVFNELEHISSCLILENNPMFVPLWYYYGSSE